MRTRATWQPRSLSAMFAIYGFARSGRGQLGAAPLRMKRPSPWLPPPAYLRTLRQLRVKIGTPPAAASYTAKPDDAEVVAATKAR